MTELQMGLIGLGATAVVGVYGYNKWQEYRHRKIAEQILKPQHDDVLLGDEAKSAAAPEVVERAPQDAPWAGSEPEIRLEDGAGRGGERIEHQSLAGRFDARARDERVPALPRLPVRMLGPPYP